MPHFRLFKFKAEEMGARLKERRSDPVTKKQQRNSSHASETPGSSPDQTMTCENDQTMTCANDQIKTFEHDQTMTCENDQIKTCEHEETIVERAMPLVHRQ